MLSVCSAFILYDIHNNVYLAGVKTSVKPSSSHMYYYYYHSLLSIVCFYCSVVFWF